MTTAASTQFTIGAEAHCSDGVCGEVSRVVVDPIAKSVTHLVVEPKHRNGLGRLVPLDLVDATGNELQIHCTQSAFDKLAPAEETEFLPANNGYGGYSPGQVLYQPYYGMGLGMGMGGMGLGNMGLGTAGIGMGTAPSTITYDTLPLGEVAVRRGEHVHATDGDIGKVQGLVIDPKTHHVTHVLLQEGHLWGRKEVAIPIGAVASVKDGIVLSMTKKDVEGLPAVDVDDPLA